MRLVIISPPPCHGCLLIQKSTVSVDTRTGRHMQLRNTSIHCQQTYSTTETTRTTSHDGDAWVSLKTHVSGIVAMLLATNVCCMPVHAESLTPYQRGLRLEYGLTRDYRIRKCDAGAQPNCVSTSSGTTRLYAPPFQAENAANAQAAMDAFDSALKRMYGSSNVDMIESMDVEGHGLYRRYAVPSALVERDYVEVLIHENKDVFYRSQGSSTKYIWPIQQPVSDLDAQRKRMAMLKEQLGWKLLVGSCSVLECYEY